MIWRAGWRSGILARVAHLGGSRMKAMHRVGVVALLIFATNSKANFPSYVPSFELGYSSWESTHIVVVTEGDKVDGEVEVLESWVGDLKKSDKLSLPDLAAFAPEEERVVSKGAKQEKDPPASVTCSRMVLFLRKREEAEKGKPTRTSWTPTVPYGLKGMKASATWIEGARCSPSPRRNTTSR